MATIKHGRDTLNDYVAVKEMDFDTLANLVSNVRNELRTYMDCRGVQTDQWLMEMVTNLEKAEKILYKGTFKFEAEKPLLVKK